VLVNLGNLHTHQHRPEMARPALDTALEIFRQVGDGRGEGVALASVGEMLLAEDRFDEARAVLARGEELLRQFEELVELGRLLCLRATLEHRLGDAAAARTALEAAEALARQVGAGPTSELGQQLAAVRRLLE